VRIVRCRNVDHIDVITLDQFAPIGLGRLVLPALGESFDFARIAGANRLSDDLMVQIEEVVDLGKRIRMSAAHEAVPDQANV
jgi:hypothetical protein